MAVYPLHLKWVHRSKSHRPVSGPYTRSCVSDAASVPAEVDSRAIANNHIGAQQHREFRQLRPRSTVVTTPVTRMAGSAQYLWSCTSVLASNPRPQDTWTFRHRSWAGSTKELLHPKNSLVLCVHDDTRNQAGTWRCLSSVPLQHDQEAEEVVGPGAERLQIEQPLCYLILPLQWA